MPQKQRYYMYSGPMNMLDDKPMAQASIGKIIIATIMTESVGTFLLMTLEIMIASQAFIIPLYPPPPMPPLPIPSLIPPVISAVVSGLCVFSVVYYLNASCNPVGTMVALIVGFSKKTLIAAAIAVVTQFIATLLAATFVRYGIGVSIAVATPMVASGFHDYNGFAVELVGTMMIACAIAAAIPAKTPLATKHRGMPILALSIVVSVASVFAFGVSGASFNPWRHLCVAIVANTFVASCWIYYVAPLIAIILAGILTKWFMRNVTVLQKPAASVDDHTRD